MTLTKKTTNGIEALSVEMGAIITPVFRAVEKIINDVALGIAMTLKAQREPAERYQIRKWLSQVPHGGIIENKAFLIVYNSEAPELSYIIKEQITV